MFLARKRIRLSKEEGRKETRAELQPQPDAAVATATQAHATAAQATAQVETMKAETGCCGNGRLCGMRKSGCCGNGWPSAKTGPAMATTPNLTAWQRQRRQRWRWRCQRRPAPRPTANAPQFSSAPPPAEAGMVYHPGVPSGAILMKGGLYEL